MHRGIPVTQARIVPGADPYNPELSRFFADSTIAEASASTKPRAESNNKKIVLAREEAR